MKVVSNVRPIDKGFPVSSGPYHSLSPDAVVAVFPFKVKRTVDPFMARGILDIESIRNSVPTALSAPLLLDKFTYNVQVSSNKSQHVGQASIQLFAKTYAILSKVTPGDWIFIWMHNDTKVTEAIRAALEDGSLAISTGDTLTPLNTFESGLKFVGRVSSVRVNEQVSANGQPSSFASITASSFREFDSDIYFNPITSRIGNGNAYLFLDRLESDVRSFYSEETVEGASASPVRSIDETVQKLVDIFLGRGVPDKVQTPIEEKLVSPNEAYLVPSEVGRVLGRSFSAGLIYSYTDILTSIYGIQQYPGTPASYTTPAEYFTPLLDPTKKLQNILKCAQSLQGVQIYVPTPWVGVPVWAALEPYLNKTINEAYTTLRVHPDNTIQPTLVVRQIPFNSDGFCKDVPTATPFTSLPRWYLPSDYTVSSSLGTSEALRVNYVKVFNQPIFSAIAEREQEEATTNAALDIDDIKRNGLVTYTPTLSMMKSSLAQAPGELQEFTNLVADRMIGGHLRLSGTVQSKGIHLPIAIGDNLYYKDYIMHIESLTHSFSVSPDGQRTFDTTIQVSNGIPAVKVDGGVYLDAVQNDIVDGPVMPSSFQVVES